MLTVSVLINDWNAIKLDDLAERWDCLPYDIVKTIVDACLDGMTVKENGEHVEMIVIPETYMLVNAVGQLAKIKEQEG